MALRAHEVVAGAAQLDAGGGVDDVVDAGVKWHEAAEQLAVGGVDNGVYLKACDVALPEVQAGFGEGHDALLVTLLLELLVLRGEQFVRRRRGLPDIHQRSEESLFIGQCVRYRRLFARLCQKQLEGAVEVLQSVHCGLLVRETFAHEARTFGSLAEVEVAEDGRCRSEVVVVHLGDGEGEVGQLVVAAVEAWQDGVVVVDPSPKGVVDMEVHLAGTAHRDSVGHCKDLHVRIGL